MSTTKRPRFIYKTATFLKEPGDGSLTLQKLIEAAVKKVPAALDRSQTAPDASTEFRFLNHAGLHVTEGAEKGLRGCEVLAYEEGADQSTIIIDRTAKEVDLDGRKADDGHEFLAGAAYLGVVGNHVILVQLKALRSVEVERYLNWLFKIKAKVLPEDNRIFLADHTPQKKISIGNVRGIDFASTLPLQPVVANTPAGDTAPEKKKREKKVIAIQPFGASWDLLKKLFNEGFDLPSELKVKNVAQAPKIEVKLSLSWKGGKKSESDEFLGSIAKNMSHVDDEFDYTVQTTTGPVKKDDFKLRQPHTVKWRKGRPALDDIFPKMAKWLAILISTGKV